MESRETSALFEYIMMRDICSAGAIEPRNKLSPVFQTYGSYVMLTRARPSKAKAARDLAAERLDRTFKGALTKVEDLARKRILHARDPIRTGLMLARDIRKVADNIDADVIAQGIDDTEAGIVREEGTT
jgi:hypothetical protein